MNLRFRTFESILCATIVGLSLMPGCSSKSASPSKEGEVAKAPIAPAKIQPEQHPHPAIENKGSTAPAAVAESQAADRPDPMPTKPEGVPPEAPAVVNRDDGVTPPIPKRDDPQFVKALENVFRALRQAGEGSRDFRNGLQSIAGQMQELPVATDDAPLKWTAIDITQISPHGEEGRKESMAVFKFRSPLDKPADMHWSFAVPESLGQWYILPVKGFMQGFNSFKVSRSQIVPATSLPVGSLFVFQELMQGRILPGQEYIVWYIPSGGTDKRLFAGVRLTPAGTHRPGTTADEIRQTVGVETSPIEFPQTPAGLRAAFEAAGRMMTFQPIDKDATQQVLRSVWSMIPEVTAATDSKPTWTHLVPEITFKFHAVRFKSTLRQAADLNWAFVLQDELIRSGLVSKDGPTPEQETYRLEVNLPISGVANPEKNLVRLQSVASNNFVPDSEHSIWFVPPQGLLPDIDVAMRLSPAQATPPADDALSIGKEIGIDVPEIPSPERVAAAFERCRKLIRDKNTMGWQFHRLLDFTAPALPWLDAKDGSAQWNKVDLTPAEKKFAAFRVGQTDANRTRVTVAVAHLQSNASKTLVDMTKGFVGTLDTQRLAWGFVYPKMLGYHASERRQQLGMKLPGLDLPPNGEVDVDVIDNWNFEEQQPLILIFAAQDEAPLAIQVAGKVVADPDTAAPNNIVTAIEEMGLKVANSADAGGIIGEHEHPVSMMQFIGEDLLVTGSFNGFGSRSEGDSEGSFIVWDTKTRMKRVSQDFESGLVIKAVSANGTRVAAMIYEVTKVFDVSAPEKSIDLKSPKNVAPDVLFSADGVSLIGCFNGDRWSPKRQSAVHIWDLQAAGMPRIHEFPPRMMVRAICELPNGQILAVGNRMEDPPAVKPKELPRMPAERINGLVVGMGELQFLDRESFKTVDTIKEDGADWAAVDVSADGSRIGALARSGWVMVWDLKTHQPIVSVPENSSAVNLQLSAGGHRMVTLSGEGAVRVWDLDARRILRQWPARTPEITKVAISPSGNLIAMGGKDHKVRLISLTTDDEEKSKNPEQMTDGIGIELNLLASGGFNMGKKEIGVPIYRNPDIVIPGADQEPNHHVQLSKPFYMGRYEVTVAQFRDFVKETNYRTTAETSGKGGSHIFANHEGFKDRPDLNWKNPGYPQQDNHPVVQVSWTDTQAFCEWLSKKEKARYRLPTEAEWEYACRAGTTSEYYYGSGNWTVKCANVPDAELAKVYGGQYDGATFKSDGYAYSSPVGSFVPNGFGLFDMNGNAWEWCSDWYDAKYYANSPADDPQGPKEGSDRVQRGGGFLAGPSSSCWRDIGPPDQTQSHLGFRVVREIP